MATSSLRLSISVCVLILNMKKHGGVGPKPRSRRGTKKKKKALYFVCFLPEKWWWKQILASRWWKGMSTPSSLTELPFRSPDSSNFAKASLTQKNPKTNKAKRKTDFSHSDEKETTQSKQRPQEMESPNPSIGPSLLIKCKDQDAQSDF